MEKKLINFYPADHWQISTPVGNGTLGASVYGAVYDENSKIATYTLDSEDDYYTLPNVKDLFVTDNYMMVDGWLVDFEEVDDNFTITYENAWNYVDSSGKFVLVKPEFVEYTYSFSLSLFVILLKSFTGKTSTTTATKIKKIDTKNNFLFLLYKSIILSLFFNILS